MEFRINRLTDRTEICALCDERRPGGRGVIIPGQDYYLTAGDIPVCVECVEKAVNDAFRRMWGKAGAATTAALQAAQAVPAVGTLAHQFDMEQAAGAVAGYE